MRISLLGLRTVMLSNMYRKQPTTEEKKRKLATT